MQLCGVEGCTEMAAFGVAGGLCGSHIHDFDERAKTMTVCEFKGCYAFGTDRWCWLCAARKGVEFKPLFPGLATDKSA